MEIELGRVIRGAVRWLWLILLTTLIGGVLAYGLTSRQEATYSATATLLVNPQQVTGAVENQALQASQTQAQTYVRLVESEPVLDRVIEELNLPYTPSALAEKIDASVVLDTQLIDVSVSNSSPEDAALIANAVAAQFRAHVTELRTGQLEENLSQLEEEISSLQERLTEINAELSALDVDTNAGNEEIQQQISQLEEERMRVQQTLADLAASVRSLDQALVLTPSPMEVADEARPAREPESPKPLLMTALGLFLGFLIGVALATLLEFMDDKIRPDADVEELTGSRVLVTIPAIRHSEAGRPLALSRAEDPETEAIRTLRTRLGSVATKGGRSAIVFASAGGATRVSEVVANLGVVMAHGGLRTLILDANMREPRQHALFGIANDGGLSSAPPTDTDSAMRPSPQSICDRLSIIPAGEGTGSAAELLGSSAFASFLQEARRQADVVLVDVPAALAYSDALSVASVSDGVVLVGRYGSTTREDLALLAETLHADGIPLLGVVMETG